MHITNVEIAFILLFIGGIAANFTRTWRTAGWLAACFVGAATVFTWIDGLKVISGGQSMHGFIVSLPRFGSELAVALDTLGAGFLMLVTAVSFIATIYSIGYMEFYTGERPRRFYSLLLLFIAGMVGVVSVSDWLFFFIFWELMTLASYFLVTFERQNPVAVRAGFKYFVITHVASIGLLVTAVVLWRVTGSFSFEAQGSGLASISTVIRSLLLGLYFLAFATKAGILPMGDWLPDAYPAAPSSASAIFAGVMGKLGAYGILRVFWGVLPDAGTQTELATWGLIVASLGVLSAFIGGLAAMRENDIKRLLAFSSISQTGYIFLALGIAVTFANAPGALASIAILGLLGAGFHILNDAVYKSLLFMNAGSILYSSGTRDLNKIGGLAATMPLIAAAGLVGALSLSGLPPTNGFASKWVIYQASISGGLHYVPFIGMAVVAFFVSLSTLAYSLKYFSSAFLGKEYPAASELMRPHITMGFAQGALAVACIVIGLAPVWSIKAIATVTNVPYSGIFRFGADSIVSSATEGVVPASWNPILMLIILLIGAVIAILIRRSGKASVRTVPGWYCGEEHSDNEVRFRAHGFYSIFNEAFAGLYPHIPLPRIPALGRFKAVLDFDLWLYGPLVRWGGSLVDKVSRSHVGIPQLYMVWQVIGAIIVMALLFILIR